MATDDDEPYVLFLYGMAQRGRELVGMVFANQADLDEFRRELPGRYRVLRVNGVDYGEIDVEDPTDVLPITGG